MIKFKRYWCPLIFGLFPLLMTAQNITQYPLSQHESFAASSVYEIVQDSLGYIWMGTDNGLYRYRDWNQFESFQDSSLREPEVYGLFLDAYQQLWFRNGIGQVVSYRKDGFYIHPEFGPGKKKAENIAIGEHGMFFYVYTNTEIYQVDPRSNAITFVARFKEKVNRPTFHFMLVYKDQIFTAPGFGLMEEVNPDFSVQKISSLSPHSVDNDISFEYSQLKLFYPRDGGSLVFIVLDNKIHPYDLRTKSFFQKDNKSFVCDNQFIRNITYHPQNGYSICTENGLYHYDSALKKVSKVNSSPQSLINFHFIDREGGQWISAMHEGLAYLPNTEIQRYNHYPISVLYATSDEQLVFGTAKGKIGFIDATRNATAFDFRAKRSIRDILEFQDYIIANSASETTLIIGKKSRSTIGELVSGGQKIVIDKEQVLFLKYTGIYQLEQSKFAEYIERAIASYPAGREIKIKAKHSKYISEQRYKSLFVDFFEQKIWVGNIGLLDYISTPDNKVHSIIDNFPYQTKAIAQSQDSSLWVATAQNGLLKIKNKKIIGQWKVEQGLPSNSCQSLIVSEEGLIWVGTAQGLVRLNPNTRQIDIINQSEGLSFPFVTKLLEQKDHIWVGTSNGLFRLRKDIVTKNDIPPNCFFTYFRIWEKDTLLQNDYHLSHQQNNLHIGFQAISYRSLGKYQYQYRMLGIDSSWVSLSAANNSLRFPQLASGDYTLEVKAKNEDGVESSHAAKIDIHISTPFWRTWWFNVLAVLCISGSIISLAYFLQYRRKELKELNQKMEDLKIKSLIAQMNPHFIFNTLNSIQYYIFQEQRESSMRYLNHFSNMIRTIFVFSQKSEITLKAEIDFIHSYLQMEQMRLEDKVKIEVNIDPTFNLESIKIPPLLIQPLLENAFKHGLMHKQGKGQVSLYGTRDPGGIKIEIIDDGIGRKAAQKINRSKEKEDRLSSSDIIQNRIKLINRKTPENKKIQFLIKDLYDKHNNATGTNVILILPL